MKFAFVMNMPSKSDNLVHTILAEHPAEDLVELLECIADTDFLLVEEFYSMPDRVTGVKSLVHHGQIGLNSMLIGKVKKMEERVAH